MIRLFLTCVLAAASLMTHAQTQILRKSQFKATETAQAPLKDGQALLGHYTTDELEELGWGFNGQGYFGAAISFTPQQLADYKGAKITAIRIGIVNPQNIQDTHFFIRTGNINNVTEAQATLDVPTAGWNTVELTQPYTITGDTLFIGFSYFQNVYNGYPFSFIGYHAEPGSALLTYSGAWGDYSDDAGMLSMQAIVEGANIAENHIRLKDLTMEHAYYQPGDDVKFFFTANRNGTRDIHDFDYAYKIDGQKEVTVKRNDTTITTQDELLSGGLTLPDSISNGRHDITLYVSKISGAQPAYRNSSDTIRTRFSVYRNKVDRDRTLIEHFTSQDCLYCPWGIETLTELSKQRDDIAWVSIHGDLGSGRDAFSFADTRTLASELANDTYPTVAVNREHLDGNHVATTFLYTDNDGSGFSAENSANVLNYVIDSLKYDVPAFATINIEPSYDEKTKLLTVNVSGEKVSDFDDIIGEGALNVYLTEDSLNAVQNNQGNYERDFIHNHVLRILLTSVDGSDIQWNGNSYNMQFTCQLKRAWKPENMHIIASIGHKLNAATLPYDNEITNAAAVDLSTALGIEGVKTLSNTDSQHLDYYDISGRRISRLSRGVYIMRDRTTGKTTKLIYK